MLIFHSWISFVFFLLLVIQITLSDVIVYEYDKEKSVEQFDDQEGNLEPSIPSSGIIGYITITDPPRACTKIAPPPNIPTGQYKWIALIPRTRQTDQPCDFAVKVANAHDANFSAVIIYNYDNELVTMQSDGRTVGIPSTFVTHSSGLSLIQKYLYNVTFNGTPTYHVKIEGESPLDYTPYLIVFMCIIAFSCLGVCGCLFVYFRTVRRRMRRNRLPRSALNKLRTKKFVKDDPWDVCAICLDDYVEGAKLRILPCEHAYHMKCIDPWLIENRPQCPVCKRHVFPNQDNAGDEEGNVRQTLRTPTEQTPLINPNDNVDSNSRENSRINPAIFPHPPVNAAATTSSPNPSYLRDDSSDNDDDDDDDDDKDLSLSSGPATTAELVFQRSSANPRRYGSTNNSSLTSRNANLLTASLGGITVNTNVSGRSLAEDSGDFETTNVNDERQHSTRHILEENAAYIDDEQSTKTN